MRILIVIPACQYGRPARRRLFGPSAMLRRGASVLGPAEVEVAAALPPSPATVQLQYGLLPDESLGVVQPGHRRPFCQFRPLFTCARSAQCAAGGGLWPSRNPNAAYLMRR